MNDAYGLYFAQPWFLATSVVVIPLVWLALRRLGALGRVRRAMAIALRCILVLLLVCLLARPMLTRQSRQLTVVAVLDRSLSIPPNLREPMVDYLSIAAAARQDADLFAVVDVAEAASISKLPSIDTEVRRRNTNLTGLQSRLADGIKMAMAILPPDVAARIVLLSEGNETSGSLAEAARTAAANGIPIDVVPIRYRSESEVIFRRLAAPTRARSSETVALRFILDSTRAVRGKLHLMLNDEPVDLVPDSPDLAADVELRSGTNVQTVSIPVGTRGIHAFEAQFIPDDSADDGIEENNRAGAIVYVAGPGHIMVMDTDGRSGAALAEALSQTAMEVRYTHISDLTDNLARLIDVDALVLANVDAASLTFQQQEMLCRYVGDLGGGLVMVGGPNAFGAGGWIGSPVARILPVDPDPPQKQQMPKGALVLIMHACEMPQGNFWGKKVAAAAVGTLSRLDLAGVLSYDWQGTDDWVFPLAPVGDKQTLVTSIEQMQMGDMPDLGAHLQKAYDALTACDAAQKHVIVISDGDPAPPTPQLLAQLKQAQITCTGVAVFPHSPADVQSLFNVAQGTGGRFYNVTDPQQLPQIFIKEAQVVRRALVQEETFIPELTYGPSEIMRGLPGVPALDGFVLTGPKAGFSQIVLSGPDKDPILATGQTGLGRCVAFTSSADARWASQWLTWPQFRAFWEQAVRWAGGSRESAGCEVFTDVEGRDVTITVETVDAEGRLMQLSSIQGQVISPEMATQPLQLSQTGPGQYTGRFTAPGSGSYVVNLQYRQVGPDARTQIKHAVVTIPFAPEFRDLIDNEPLLTRISDMTGGRILPADPNLAELYERSGLDFPKAYLPLTRPLLLVWVVVLLLDVAVRRVVIDFRAIARRFSRAARKPQTEAEQVLSRLKATRKQVHDKMVSTAADAARRYEAGEIGDAKPPALKAAQAKPAVKDEEQTPPPKPAGEPERSHIDRLLRAKRKASGRDEDRGTRDEATGNRQ